MWVGGKDAESGLKENEINDIESWKWKQNYI